MLEITGFLLYCAFIYIIDKIEYNFPEFILAITGNLE